MEIAIGRQSLGNQTRSSAPSKKWSSRHRSVLADPIADFINRPIPDLDPVQSDPPRSRPCIRQPWEVAQSSVWLGQADAHTPAKITQSRYDRMSKTKTGCVHVAWDV